MNTRATADANAGLSPKSAVTVIGFGRRLVAMLVDGLLVVLLTFVVLAPIACLAPWLGLVVTSTRNWIGTLMVLIGLGVSVAYYTRLWSTSGQTPGKQVMNIKVVGRDGAPISWGRALVRYIGYLLSGLILSLGFLWIAFDPKRQGWHDLLAGTYVVSADERFAAGDDVEFVPSDPNQKWVWFVLWVLVALMAPAALLGSLLFLGPTVSRLVLNLVAGLR